MRALLFSLYGEFVLAMRNVLRQRRRAAFALTIIVGGVISLLLAGGFIKWVPDTMRDSTIYSQLGHIQVVRPDYFRLGLSDPYRYLLPKAGAEQESIRKNPSVVALTPRLSFAGLISLGDATLSFAGDGVDPKGEEQFAEYFYIEKGERLSSDDPTGIVIGQGLASNLGAKVGDRLVLMTSTAKGGMNAHDVHIRGIFFTAEKSYDDSAIQVPIDLARKLVRVEGATSWLVVLDDTSKTDKVRQELARLVDPAKFELVPWYDLADFYMKTVTLFVRQVAMVKLLIGVVIVLSIFNTLSMAVVERTSEIGTVMALGVRRKGVLRMFLFEGLALGLIGGTIGAVVGWVLSVVISAIGIPMPPPPGMESDFTGQITVTFGMAVEAVSIALITTLIAGIIPAWQASRLNIVDALRHQR